MILFGKRARFTLAQLSRMLDAPSGQARRELLITHRAELDRHIAQAEAAREMIDHALSCEADDFTQCPGFRRVVDRITSRVPISGGPAEG